MRNTLKPLADRVLVLPSDDREKQSKGGIYVPDSTKRGKSVFGEVVGVGSGIYGYDGKHIPMTVQVGDLVLYKKDMAGDPITVDGVDYLVFREGDLLMVDSKNNTPTSPNVQELLKG